MYGLYVLKRGAWTTYDEHPQYTALCGFLEDRNRALLGATSNPLTRRKTDDRFGRALSPETAASMANPPTAVCHGGLLACAHLCIEAGSQQRGTILGVDDRP
jgi:hypothetical protein